MSVLSLGVIPARYASSRFPGKPLVLIDGKSMIMRVYEQASRSASLSKVIVATDDERIFSHVEQHGGNVIMTSDLHVSGTSRIGEVAGIFSHNYPESVFDVIVNIQGDEPYIDPTQIDLIVSLFNKPEVQIGTLIRKIDDSLDLRNPNVVKVVVDKDGKALYFSRSAIPYLRGVLPENWVSSHEYFRHIGLYAYRTEVLEAITKLPESPVEIAESLEQLRWLYHGYKISTARTEIETIGIDAPEDLLKLTNNA